MDAFASLSIDQKLAIYSAFGAALLGGFIALISSLAMFGLANSYDRKKKEKENRLIQISDAHNGALKLLAIANDVELLERHVSEQYKRANVHINDDIEPSNVVRPIVGFFGDFERLSNEELFFLLGEKNDLINQIHEYTGRASNLIEIIRHYNIEKRRLNEFFYTHADDLKYSGEDLLDLRLSGKSATIAHAMIGDLNVTVGSILTSLAEDKITGRRVISSYMAHAKSRFGEDFKIPDVVWLEN